MPPILSVERNTNKHWHTVDSEFILFHTLSTLAFFADLEMTARSLAQQSKAIELNPLFGERLTLARLHGASLPLKRLLFLYELPC